MVFPLNQILNVSSNLQIAIYLENYWSLPKFFFNDVEEHEFPLNRTNGTSKGGLDFSLQSPEFYSFIQFEIKKKIGLLILLKCETASLTVFTTRRPKEQQTSDNLIIKDYCFIIEIFDKCNFSGILRGCLSRLNEA